MNLVSDIDYFDASEVKVEAFSSWLGCFWHLVWHQKNNHILEGKHIGLHFAENKVIL